MINITSPKLTNIVIMVSLFAFALFLILTPTSAQANHVDAEVSISNVSPIFVSVSNLSNSTNVNDRLLTMTTPAEVTVKGTAQCTDGSVSKNIQLHFGLEYIESGANGHTLWGIWDSSVPQVFETISTAYDITHNINISPTWELGTLVTLQPNAVKVVEDNLKAYVNNGGSAIDFLRQDWAFETSVTASVTVTCERNGNEFFDTVSQPTTMYILYKGDKKLVAETIGENPNQINPNQPKSPAFALPKPGPTPASPLYFVARLIEGVGTFFTFGDEAKIERHLMLAERRLAGAMALAEEGDERVQTAIDHYERQFAKAKERSERRGYNAVNVKTAGKVEGGDTNEETDDQTNADSRRDSSDARADDILARVAEATTRHLAVLDEVLERVPEQEKPAIRAAQERSVRGQIETLRRIAEEDPEAAALIFERATEARTAYYMKFDDIKGEANDQEMRRPISSDFLVGYEEYTRFGRELSAMSQNIRTGETTVDRLLERIVNRQKVILFQIMERAPEEARENIHRVLTKTTPRPTERPDELTDRPSEQRNNIPTIPLRGPPTPAIPAVVPPRTERVIENGGVDGDYRDVDDDNDGISTQIELDRTVTERAPVEIPPRTDRVNENEGVDADDDNDSIPTQIEFVRTVTEPSEEVDDINTTPARETEETAPEEETQIRIEAVRAAPSADSTRY